MSPRGLLTLIVVVAVIAVSCSDDRSSDVSGSTMQPRKTSVGVDVDPAFSLTLPGAISANVASNGTDMPAVAWSTHDEVLVARLDIVSGTLSETIDVSGQVAPFAHPIERPAVAVTNEGSVQLAFTSLGSSGGSVYHTTLTGDFASEPVLISGEPEPETNLVHMTLDREGVLVMAWLENSTLSVATEHAGGLAETEIVDDRTCDCCNPVPMFVSDDLVVSYRDYDTVDNEVVRDVAVVRSTDGGLTFEEPLVVADDHWYINACPFTGPSSVVVDDVLVVAWMDARQSLHPDQATSTIWVDRSTDGGATFGDDHAVAGDAIHRWPVMAFDGQMIHLFWETQGPDGGLSYSYSTDDGVTFSEPMMLIETADGDGSPKSPSVAYHDGYLIVTWTDNDGGHVAGWAVAA